MNRAPQEERAPHPSLAWFAAKIAFSVGWLAATAFAAATLLRSGERAAIVGACLLLLLGPLTWLLAKAHRLARADEAERAVMMRGLAQGLLFAIAWPGAMIGGTALASLFIGAGEINVGGMLQNALTYIAIMPPIAFFISELCTFALLRVYARKPDA